MQWPANHLSRDLPLADVWLTPLLALAAVTWWLVLPLRAALNHRRLPLLAEFDYDESVNWPRVSVLVPARNEASTLQAAMQSLLRVDYPNLEIIIVDDRSGDATGKIIEQLEEEDSRIRSLRIDTLADGWLGKVYAMHRGLEICTGEWLLFTDADVHFSPQILKRAIACCERQHKDFVTLLPEFFDTRPLLAAAQAAFAMILLSALDRDKITAARSRAAMGIGAFNLARKSFLDKREGLEWLRMEVADDAGLGLMMKRRGAAIDIRSGRGLLKVDWYPSLRAMMDGVMQRVILGANYRLPVYLLHCVLVCLCLVAPLGLTLALLPQSLLAWLCVAAYLLPMIILRTVTAHFDLPPKAAWGLPLGLMIIAFGMLRTLLFCFRYGGIHWRGSVYSLKDLRAGQRVRMSAFLLP